MLRQVSVVSGKGGTGKTSLTALWSTLAERAVLVDADVDASNLPLALAHTERQRQTYIGRHVAVVDDASCTACGACASACRFEAFRTVQRDGDVRYEVDALACEGCTLCELACPTGAITMHPHESGEWFVSDTEYGPLVHARLGVAEGNSGKLVTQVRRIAEDIAEAEGRSLILIDGPPGIGCQTTAALTGADLAVLVTEPSASGRHDMGRLLSVIDRLGLPAVVVLNKADLAPDQRGPIERLAAQHGARFVGSIPFVPEIPRLLAMGTLVASPPPALMPAVQSAWEAALECIGD